MTTAHFVSVDTEPFQASDVDDVASTLGDSAAGDAVVVRAGWEDHAGMETYHGWPHFTDDFPE